MASISKSLVNFHNFTKPFFFALAFTAFLLCALAALALANNPDELYHGNGRPGCASQMEVNTREWRNTWDPNAFWVCETLGVPARADRCHVQGFMTGRGCVDWGVWQWERPVAPPSAAPPNAP